MTEVLPTIQATAANRAEVQALYLQGIPVKSVAEKTGVNHSTIRTWINRYHWDLLRLKVGHKIEQKIEKTTTEPILSQPVAKASERVRKSISDDLEKASELLSKVRHSKKVDVMRERQEVVSKIVQSANKVFGWDQQSASTIASVQSLSSELPIEQNRMINVKEVTVEETKPPLIEGNKP